MTLEGIDISHHQATTPDLASVDFVIARATFGAQADREYADHAAATRAAGALLGAYHFARPATAEPIERQASAFLHAAGDADFLAVDREVDQTVGAMISRADTRKLLEFIQSAGRRVGLYASQSVFVDAKGQVIDLGQDWAWVARWGTAEPSIPWDIWQHRGAPLDLDRFRGTREALLALGGFRSDWVRSSISALAERATTAEAEVARLTAELASTEAARAAAQQVADRRWTEINSVVEALSVLDEFRVNHEGDG